MVPLVRVLEVLRRDLRVDLGRRKIRMPEQHLQSAQVHAALKQVRGK